MKDLKTRLDEIQKVIEGATAGPWEYKFDPLGECIRKNGKIIPTKNAEFIAQSRTFSPQLVEALRACIEGFEGTYGASFWESPLAKTLQAILCEGE